MTKPNRLISESSAYLLQHAENPVDWFPWGNEAFEQAKRLDRPVFLSIGYSACHWCHVMEVESFSDESIAALLNENFVSIKVDREERPDIDHIYMAAVQILSQRGGWPLTVFLTPDRNPFYGGTYFPPDDRYGMSSFRRVLSGIMAAWKSRRDEVTATSEQLTASIRHYFTVEGNVRPKPNFFTIFEHFIKNAMLTFDSDFGGFGQSPKFFHTEQLRLFLRHYRYTGNMDSLNAVSFSLDHIQRGGTQDQLGGGFHRYSTDRQWLVPHFEKMLYDNALLATTFIEAYLETKNSQSAKTARRTLDFVLRDMISPEGAFVATFDADSEGVEGKFYVWSKAEIEKLLPPDDASLFCEHYGVTDSGNWEGHNILNIPSAKSVDEAVEERLEKSTRVLMAARQKRVPPHRDEKIITAWNAMVIEALALAGFTLGDSEYLDAAERASDFICTKMLTAEGLAHSFAQNNLVSMGFLDDYAYLFSGLLELHLATNNPRWLGEAIRIRDLLISRFWDEKTGQFFYTPENNENIARPRETHDGAIPCAAAIAVLALAKLALLKGDTQSANIANRALETIIASLEEHPAACGSWILAADFLWNDPRSLVLVTGKIDSSDLTDNIRSLPRSNRVFWIMPEDKTLFPDKRAVDGKPTLYVCTERECESANVGESSINQRIDELFPRRSTTHTKS